MMRTQVAIETMKPTTNYIKPKKANNQYLEKLNPIRTMTIANNILMITKLTNLT